MFNSNFDTDKVFGVKEASEVNTEDMELLYELDDDQEGDPKYLRLRVYRDKDGKYYLAVKGGTKASPIFELSFPICGREILIQVSPEALADWSEPLLFSDDYERAMEEFKAPEIYTCKLIWQYQQGCVYEFLWQTDGGLYMLFSTEYDYPYPGRDMPYLDVGSGTCRDDLYLYYVTPEIARRWAEARGMDEMACQNTFGD